MIGRIGRTVGAAAAALLAGTGTAAAQTPPGDRVFHGLNAAAARAMIVEGNRVWGRARVELDTVKFDSMLTADFWVQIGPARLDKRQFIERITNTRGGRLRRFDVDVLTVRPTDQGWIAVIQEKLEVDVALPDGRSARAYSLWVTRDEWRVVGDRWLIASSEAIGNESWPERPPFADW